MPVKISVVIPTYKRPERLKKALSSILTQSFDSFDVIVVDDNSDPEIAEETKRVVDHLSADTNRTISYLKTPENMGGALARNLGAEKATGTYLAFLDDDDYWRPDFLSHLHTFFADHDNERLALVHALVSVQDEKGKVLEINGTDGGEDSFHTQLLGGGIARTPSILFKRKVFTESGGFKKLISGQEYELLLRIFSMGYASLLLPEELVVAVIHKDERISNRKSKLEGEKNILAIRMEYRERMSESEIVYLESEHHQKCADLAIMNFGDYRTAAFHLNEAKKLKKSRAVQGKILLCKLHLYRMVRKFGRLLRQKKTTT